MKGNKLVARKREKRNDFKKVKKEKCINREENSIVCEMNVSFKVLRLGGEQ